MSSLQIAQRLAEIRVGALDVPAGLGLRARLAYRQALTLLEQAQIAFELADIEQARELASMQTGGKLP